MPKEATFVSNYFRPYIPNWINIEPVTIIKANSLLKNSSSSQTCIHFRSAPDWHWYNKYPKQGKMFPFFLPIYTSNLWLWHRKSLFPVVHLCGKEGRHTSLSKGRTRPLKLEVSSGLVCCLDLYGKISFPHVNSCIHTSKKSLCSYLESLCLES